MDLNFLNLVAQMREKQRAFFRAKKASYSSADAHAQALRLLDESRALEREVDAAIEAARQHIADEKQTKLF